MNNCIHTTVATVTKLNEDLLCVEYHQDVYVDIAQLAEAREAYRKLMGEKKFYLLTVINSGVTHSLDARKEWLKKKRSTFKLAEAFVIDNLPHRMIANFVMRVTPPPHKMNYFANEYRALEWLLKQKARKN